MKQILCMVLCLSIAACAAPSRRQDPGTSTAQPTITARNFADADPHPETVIAGRLAVHGVDVSRFQTAVDWQHARENGVNFAFIKATEGGDLLDPMFRDHWRGAARAGIPRGAYHFFYHCRAASEQALWFIRNVPRTSGSLPPVLDMEWTPFSPTCTTRRDGAVIRAEAMVFIRAIEAHYGQRPVLYTSVDFYEDNEMWKLPGVEFWLRSVAAHPRDRYAGQQWKFWQYTSTGLVPGIKGKADINAFSGGASAWAEWLARRQVQ
jgi:lysozyme